MRPLRLDVGLLIAALAGLITVPLLFASWFCIPAGSISAEGAIAVTPERCWNAWTSFGTIDLILFFTAVAAIGLAVAAVFKVGFPVLPGPVLTVLGGISFLLVAYRLVNPPWAGAGRSAAPFLALLCMAGIVGGGLLSSRIQARTRNRRRSARGSRERNGGQRVGRRPLPAGTERAEAGFNDFNREA